MRLLQVTPSYKPAFGYGGTIVSVGLLCEALANRDIVQKSGIGEDVEMLVLTTTANVTSELPEHSRTPIDVNGVPVLYFRRWTKDHSHFSPALLGYLWRHGRQYDVVHIQSWWNLVAMGSVLVCLLRGIRPVVSPRGMLSSFTVKGKIKKLFHHTVGKWLLSQTYLHATAEQERDEGLDLIPNWQNIVLPNLLEIPVSVERTHVGETLKVSPTSGKVSPTSGQSEVFKILFLSRVHEKKGIDLLLDALKSLPFDWTLTIGGDGESSYIEALKTKAENNGIGLKINWLGWIEPTERFDYFAAADLFVLPSHNENFANVVLESLAVGTPVLVSQYVGLSGYVAEKKLGWVCDTHVKSLSQKLIEAYFQKAERARIQAWSPHLVRRDFDSALLAERYLAFYQTKMGYFSKGLDSRFA
jgi:glycosyltransferase involved in cell wall biosynthesis